MTKLHESVIKEMRLKRSEGWTQGAIARYFKVSIGHVGRVLRGEVRQGQNPHVVQTFEEQAAYIESPEFDAKMMAARDEGRRQRALEQGISFEELSAKEEAEIQAHVAKLLARKVGNSGA